MKRSAVLILLALDWNRAFTPPYSQRQRRQQRRQQRRHGVGLDDRSQRANVALFENKRRQERNSQVKRYKTSKKKPSPEYLQALDFLLHLSDANNIPQLLLLSPREKVDLIHDLATRGRYETCLEFSKQHPQHTTEAVIISALSKKAPPEFRRKVLHALVIENDPRNMTLSSRTCVAIFRCVQGVGGGGASAAHLLLKRLQNSNSIVTVDVWNAAIYASSDCWQTALSMLREMRKQGVDPDERSYAHVMHACAQSGQVRIALSLLEELSSSSSSSTTTSTRNPQIYGAALNACAKANSVKDALVVLKHMQDRSIPINTVHIGALLSALANCGDDQSALTILRNFQNGTSATLVLEHDDDNYEEQLSVCLQPVTLDLVAINTILAACSKADNFQKANEILQQLKSGECHFGEGLLLAPDVISYNTVLSACSNALEAKQLVKEMRASRRWRYGVVLPTTITYTHAISACKGSQSDEGTAVRFFLDLAHEDGLDPNVYMYSAAIWACPEMALEYWEEMRTAGCAPNVVSYNGVISALASQGRAEEALSLYEELKDDKNLRPNRITFQVRKVFFWLRHE
jgi:pentatricopeptide repeat protein